MISHVSLSRFNQPNQSLANILQDFLKKAKKIVNGGLHSISYAVSYVHRNKHTQRRHPMTQFQFALNTYAGDGLCHNANSGTYGHECGKPAELIGTNDNAFRTGFCSHCAKHGSEFIRISVPAD